MLDFESLGALAGSLAQEGHSRSSVGLPDQQRRVRIGNLELEWYAVSDAFINKHLSIEGLLRLVT